MTLTVSPLHPRLTALYPSPKPCSALGDRPGADPWGLAFPSVCRHFSCALLPVISALNPPKPVKSRQRDAGRLAGWSVCEAGPQFSRCLLSIRRSTPQIGPCLTCQAWKTWAFRPRPWSSRPLRCCGVTAPTAGCLLRSRTCSQPRRSLLVAPEPAVAFGIVRVATH